MDLPTAMRLQVKSGSIKLTELFSSPNYSDLLNVSDAFRKLTELFSSLNYGESEWYRILLLLLLLNLNIKIHI